MFSMTLKSFSCGFLVTSFLRNVGDTEISKCRQPNEGDTVKAEEATLGKIFQIAHSIGMDKKQHEEALKLDKNQPFQFAVLWKQVGVIWKGMG